MAREKNESGPWKQETSSMSINEALSQVMDEIRAGDITDKEVAIQRIKDLANYQQSLTKHAHDCLDSLL